MKKIYLLTVIIICITSCSQVKNIAYFQNIQGEKTFINKSSFEARIKPGDILSITVVSSEPEASRRYNLITPQLKDEVSSMITQPTLQNYLVDKNGNIDFPILGVINVQGMNKIELGQHIEKELRPFFTDEMPVITIRFMNYSVNVLGEVLHPGKYETTNERITIFEGLALAGDMTIYGRRDNVKVLREDANGERNIYTLNLNDSNIFSSPAYFLEQNDVVYVEPNQSRANSSKYGAAETYRISTISVLISLATMAAAIVGLVR
jgi:polysaccharide export outer membrane protein